MDLANGGRDLPLAASVVAPPLLLPPPRPPSPPSSPESTELQSAPQVPVTHWKMLKIFSAPWTSPDAQPKRHAGLGVPLERHVVITHWKVA
jgi:hypothetical protein